MKTQRSSVRKLDQLIDIEKLYYEYEASKAIPDNGNINPTIIDHLRKEFITQSKQLKKEKSTISDMLNILYKTDPSLQEEIDNRDFRREDKYLISKKNNVQIIDSIEKAIESLSKNSLTKLDDQNDRSYYFRGHEDADYRSVPSIMRTKEYYINEDQLYYELQTISPKNFSHSKKHLEILTEMQHFSLPTRLLDISSNPLSALFFATNNTDPNSVNKDGEIIVFSAHKKAIKNFSSDTVEIQNSLAFLPYDLKSEIYALAKKFKDKKPKYERIIEFNQSDHVKKLIHEARKSGLYFSNVLDPSDLFEFMICLPLKNNDRIMNQSGAFISYGFTSSEAFKSEIENEHDRYERRLDQKFGFKTEKQPVQFIIPYSNKEHIRNQLDEFGINQGNIYPDIEKRAAYIKEKYLKLDS